MIPIRDQLPTRITPFINYSLIAINVAVFLFQLSLGTSLEAFFNRFALIPVQITGGGGLAAIDNVFTSMFMHAGLAHIGGNMLYLWIFGDNVEEAMGHWRYLIFYLLGGVIASAAHILTNPNSPIPTVGASGAIAAVLGAYMVLYPRSRVVTLLFLGYFIRLAAIPAIIVLGLWFVLQLLQGVASLGMAEMVGGVAFWAHIGGFAAGYLLARIFASARPSYGVERW